MKAIVLLLERLERAYLALMVFASILLSVTGVFYRYFLNSSLAFVEELAGFMLAGIVVIGASMAITAREHIRVDVVTRFLPWAQRWLNALAWLVVLIVSSFMFVLTARFVHKLLVTNQMSTALEQLAIGWPLIVMPIGYMLCVVKSLWLLVSEVTGPGTVPEGDAAGIDLAMGKELRP